MFSDRAKLIALAIVHVFETSKPFGDYSAVAVLDDGAGVSYGINQFTHRSGSLFEVLSTYLDNGGTVGASDFELRMPTLRQTSSAAIVALSNDHKFKILLKDAGKTPEMHAAQQYVMERKYLGPAVKACTGSHFESPLALAVIYDSVNHGSWEHIRDRVTVDRSFYPSNTAFEQAWISAYVRERHAWLKSAPRLAKTSYRTAFFLEQIVQKNWDLDLPLHCHGVELTEKMFSSSATAPAVQPTNGVRLDPSVMPTEDPPEIEPSPMTVTTSEELAPDGTISKELTASSFQPETITQYIPQITTARNWLSSLGLGGFGATLYAAGTGFPIWAVFLIGFLTAVILCGLVVLFIVWKKEIFALVKHVATINADPATNTIQLTAEKKGV